MHKNRTARVLAGLGATAALVLAAPLAASAHVTVDPGEVAAGSYPTVNLRVPTESETASTVGIVVTLPTDHPFIYVGYQAVPGWTVTVEEAALPEPIEVEGAEVTEAPATITFTADAGGGIRPGEFQQFPIVLGPVPDGVDTIVLPAVQTYDDGTVAEWTATPDEVAADDTLEPAPVLTVGAAQEGDHHGTGMTDDAAASGDEVGADASGDGAAGSTTASASGVSTGAALGLGVSGLVVGAAGAVVAVIALLRTRRTS